MFDSLCYWRTSLVQYRYGSACSQVWSGRFSGSAAGDLAGLIRKAGSCRADVHRICECSERASLLFAKSEAGLLCVGEV